MPGLIKNIIEGGLKGLGETAKGIIGEVLDGKKDKAQALLEIDKEANRHSEEGVSQANEIEKARLADIANSRDANARIQESASASWMAKNVGYFLDIFVTLIWASLTFYIAGKYLNIIKSAPGVDFSGVWGLYSTVTGMATIVLSWHRGSSKGSEDKQKTMDNMLKK